MPTNTLVDPSQYADDTNYKNRKKTMEHIQRKDTFWEWIASHYIKANILTDKTILDIGCGDAEIWPYLTTQITDKNKITLADRSEGMLASATAVLSKMNLPCTVNAEVADVEALAFNDGAFGFVMAHMMLYHASSITAAINEIKRVCVKDKSAVVGITTLSLHACETVYQLAHRVDKRFQPYTYSAPFASEVARSLLPKFFADVHEEIYETEMIFKTPETIITMLRSLEGVHHLTLDERFYELCANEAQSIINKQRVFNSSFQGSLFLCR